MGGRKTLLLGATGLVGRELLKRLLRDDAVDPLIVIGRSSTGVIHPKLREQVFDLAEMEKHGEAFEADRIFCALGTTMKQARSRARFRTVDHDYPLAAARLGLTRGARHYLLVSSSGANPRSRIFYSRIKGEVERDLLALGYPAVTIARPSFLLGERSEPRIGERIITSLGFLLPLRYRPIEAETVAAALVAASRDDSPGVRILTSAAMQQAGEVQTSR